MLGLFSKKKNSEQNNPLHEAVLENDAAKFQEHVQKRELFSQTNAMGFTPLDLAKCFNRSHFFSSLSQKCTIPPFEKDGQVFHFSEKELEDNLGITYLHHVEFYHLSALQWVVKRCQRALQEKSITKEQKWLGSYFQKEISSLYVPPLVIRWIDSTIGWGVFAGKTFTSKDYIGEYVGYFRKRKKRIDQKNSYCFEYFIGESEETPFTIDAKDKGNFTRFINHSSKPNCDPMMIYSGGIMRVIIYANQTIPKGTQLTYDYGPDYWAKREAPNSIEGV